MQDVHGNPLKIGDREVIIKGDDWVVPRGSIGYVVNIKTKPRDWSRARKYPEHAAVKDRMSDDPGDFEWASWCDPDEIVLLKETAAV